MSQARLFADPVSRRLPLVGDKPWLRGVDLAQPIDRDPACNRCPLAKDARVVCMDGHGARGGVLVVLGAPTHQDDAVGGFTQGGTNGYLVQQVARHVAGPVRYAHAVRCAPGKEIPERAVESCRPYLAREMEGASRVVVLGDVAARSVYGKPLQAIYQRRSWVWVRGVPTYLVPTPLQATRNRFVKQWFEADLEWALTTPVQPRPDGEVRVLLNRGEVAEYLAELNTRDTVVVDIENDGDTWGKDFRLLCVGLCQDPTRPVVIPGDVAVEAREELGRFLEDPAYAKGGSQIKGDRQGLWRALGKDMAGIEADTMLWNRLRASDARAGLGPLGWLVGFGGYKDEAHEAAEEEGKRKRFGKMPPDMLHQYNARDTASNALVIRHLRPRMAQYIKPWERLVGPAMDALAHVERWGALLSPDNVKLYDRWLAERIDRERAEIQKHPEVWPGFSPTSSDDKAKLIFEKLGIKPDKKNLTSTGRPSVDADVLEELRDRHPLIPAILTFAQLEKQRSTYGLGMLGHVGYDGRVHTTYKIIRSGRLSSSEPNLQNVTRPDEEGDEGTWARGCFVAPPGHKLLNLDYAQQELRVAAMLSGDEVMAAAFESGFDFHTMTGAAGYGVPPEQVTKAQRGHGKSLNFAMVFGQSEYGIARSIRSTPEHARSLFEGLLGKYKKFGEWRRRRIAEAQNTGASYVEWQPETLGWIHKRDIWRIGEVGEGKLIDKIRKHEANVALNDPIQNVANCFSLASLTEVVRWILEERVPVRLVITVHDSLLLEVPDAMVEEVARAVRRIMLQWPSGCVKLKVDVEVGDDWGNLKKLPLSG